MLVADTCVLIFDALTPERLTPRAQVAIAAAESDGSLCCSDISLWEISMLVHRGRLDPGTGALDFLRLLLAARRLRVLPIGPEIADLAGSLDLHGDPADRVIAATAVHHQGILLTPDHKLRASQAVQTVW
jgi:PIN domain nuclease of toxin-antitoxin system